MTHPLVSQLRFARAELERALAGVTDAEAHRRFERLNCMSWMVGHLTNQKFVGDIGVEAPYRPE